MLLGKFTMAMFNSQLLVYQMIYYMVNNLVGGFNPSEKYGFVTWDDDIPNTNG